MHWPKIPATCFSQDRGQWYDHEDDNCTYYDEHKEIYFYALLLKLIFDGGKQAETHHSYLWSMHTWTQQKTKNFTKAKVNHY